MVPGFVEVSHPLECCAIDIVQYPKSEQGRRYALVFIDHFSKFLAATPLKSLTTQKICKKLEELMVLGTPERLITDNARTFTSQQFKEFCLRRGIQLVHSSPYHPQGNSTVERAIRTLSLSLAKKCEDDPLNWPDKLRETIDAYQRTVHTATGCTPLSLVLESDERKLGPVRERLKEIQESRQDKASQKAGVPHELAVGDEVFIKNHSRKQLEGGKLNPTWCGPCRVVDVYPFSLRVLRPDGLKVKASRTDVRRRKALGGFVLSGE